MACWMRMGRICGLACGLVLGVAGAADAAVIYDETVSGDLTNNPVSIGTLAPGVNEVIGFVGVPDIEDWFSVTLPTGLQIVGVSVEITQTSTGPSGTLRVGSEQLFFSGPGLYTLTPPPSEPSFWMTELATPNGYGHRWLISVVPEPATGATLVAGLLGLAVYSRRARRTGA